MNTFGSKGHAAVIAGGGPTGLRLAGELALAGVDVAIVERRASRKLDGLRSGGLHSRAIEELDQRGIADRFLAEGQAMQNHRRIGDRGRGGRGAHAFEYGDHQPQSTGARRMAASSASRAVSQMANSIIWPRKPRRCRAARP